MILNIYLRKKQGGEYYYTYLSEWYEEYAYSTKNLECLPLCSDGSISADGECPAEWEICLYLFRPEVIEIKWNKIRALPAENEEEEIDGKVVKIGPCQRGVFGYYYLIKFKTDEKESLESVKSGKSMNPNRYAIKFEVP